MSIEYILYLMATATPGELTCYDEQFNYYQMVCCGYFLMYRKNRYRDGRRCFYLTDELAHCLGYGDLHTMRLVLSTLQYWRRFVSVERLRIALYRCHQRQEKFRQEAEAIGWFE